MPYTSEKSREYQKQWTINNRERRREHSRNWKRKNRERIKIYTQEWWKKNRKRFTDKYRLSAPVLRAFVIENYGNKCACCAEERKEFLCIDHINGGGREHRAKVGIGYHLYKWIINNDFPDSLRILCHNCNMAIGIYGYCPHNLALK